MDSSIENMLDYELNDFWNSKSKLDDVIPDCNLSFTITNEDALIPTINEIALTSQYENNIELPLESPQNAFIHQFNQSFTEMECENRDNKPN